MCTLIYDYICPQIKQNICHSKAENTAPKMSNMSWLGILVSCLFAPTAPWYIVYMFSRLYPSNKIIFNFTKVLECLINWELINGEYLHMYNDKPNSSPFQKLKPLKITNKQWTVKAIKGSAPVQRTNLWVEHKVFRRAHLLNVWVRFRVYSRGVLGIVAANDCWGNVSVGEIHLYRLVLQGVEPWHVWAIYAEIGWVAMEERQRAG